MHKCKSEEKFLHCSKFKEQQSYIKECDQVNFNKLAGNDVQIFLPVTIDGLADPNGLIMYKNAKQSAIKQKEKHILHPVQKKLNQRRINTLLTNLTPKPEQTMMITGENFEEAEPVQNIDTEEMLITNCINY